MKPFGKTEDGVIDSLLRAYVSRPINPPQSCSGFDPDLANAYIERSLPPASRSGYERHLSECGACRKNVSALVRLADVSGAAPPVSASGRANWWSGVRKVFGALSQPQWAMAGTAVLVLAISLPVLLSRDSTRPAKQAAADSVDAGQQPVSNPQATNQPAAVSAVATSKGGAADSLTSLATPARKREIDRVAANSADAARNAGEAGAVASVLTESQRSEAKSMSPPADDPQRKPQAQLAQAPTQGGAAASQVAKNESDQSRSQTPTKDSAQQAPEAPPGRADETRDKEKTAKSEEVAPPPATSSGSEVSRMRGLKRPAPKLALRDSSGESVRPNLRKISKKDFWFKDSTWTDKEFDPNKNLPVVTIVYDSNVYKEEIAKRTGLKPYLTAFSETDRAIIVYKGKVYKLIPQR